MNGKSYRLEDWTKIMGEVESLGATTFDSFTRTNLQGWRSKETSHFVGKKIHSSVENELVYKQGEGWQIILYWNVCHDCGVRWKYIIAWNNLDGLAYESILLRPKQREQHGTI